MVEICIEDDGGGLQREVILNKAIEKGLCAEGVELADQDVYKFIFASNFSTKGADEIDDLSGRGVGMDVVKTCVEDLGGEIRIESVLGIGTKFQILLPLTVSIIDGLVCEDNTNNYIIPLLHVDEVIQVSPDIVGEVSGKGHMINVRDQEMPLYGLEDSLCQRKYMAKIPEEKFICVISAVGGKRKAFKVDELMGVQQLVIKPLGAEFEGYSGAMGGAILGSGAAGIILDMSAMLDILAA